MLPNTFSFVDIETTGGSVTGDRIIEIGILRVEDGKIVEKFESLVNPHHYIPEFITGITGIRADDLTGAPSFEELQEKIYPLLENSVFVAHNARFDYGFIRNEFRRQDYTFSAKVLCTAKLSRLLYPHHRKHNLDSIIQRFGFTCERRHRAFDDAAVLWDYYQAMMEEFGVESMLKAVQQVMKLPSTPIHLSQEELDRLPEMPGIYEFYGDQEVPLYIGKSTNIRERVLSHFSGDHARSAEMDISQQIKRIETIPTAGELGALLLESELVKHKQPVYNRHLRIKNVHTVIFEERTPEGYKIPKITEISDIPGGQVSSILHIAKSKRQAKEYLEELCRKHSLCRKLMGVEKTKTSCFSYKLGQCHGACIGEELVDSYNLLFDAVFDNYRILPWPYPGKILIQEENQIIEKKELFVFENWCYLGKVDEESVYEIPEMRFEHRFDYDIYKIIRGFLRKKSSRVVDLSVLPAATSY
jgi:DNA polymerase-3 subunit epsilon